MQTPLERVLERLKDPREKHGRWMALCPAHDDSQPSLSVKAGEDGNVLLKCFAGCTTEAVVRALRLEMRDLFPDTTTHSHLNGNGSAPPAQWVVAAVYPYKDRDDTLLYEVVRYREPDGSKTFRQRRPDGKGGYVWSLDGVPRVLYRLPELSNVGTEQWVFVVEGEKDADNLTALGLLATTNVGGAAAPWLDEYSEALQGARVCVLPDNDEPGLKHAEQVAASLDGCAREVKALPDLAEKGDVSDWLQAGGSADALIALADAAPAYVLQNVSEPEQRAQEREQTPSAETQRAATDEAYANIPADVIAHWHEEWRAATATGRGDFYTAQAFLDEYLRSVERKGSDPIPNVLPEGEVMVLVGAAGSGKTTTLVNLAMQKGEGIDLFGVWECEAGPVLYCATEDLYGVAERFASALAQQEASAATARLHFHDKLPALVQPPAFGQKAAGGWDFFLSVRAEQYRGNLPDMIALVILDYLRNATEGANENSNDDMGLVLGLVDWARFGRVVRGDVLTVRNNEYMGAARSVGLRHGRIILGHVLPNMLSSIIVLTTFSAARLMLTESALSFLGLGVTPPATTWGGMISSGRDYILDAWWISEVPGALITLTVLSINLVGDGLHDAFDPRGER